MSHRRIRTVAWSRRQPACGSLALLAGLAMTALLAGCQLGGPPPAPAQPTTAATGIAQATVPSDGPATATPPAAAALVCDRAPAGWVEYMVDIGDTLLGLSERTGLDVATIQRGNCLTSEALLVGQRLLLPPFATPTPTPCVRVIPAGWGGYLVRPGDTLASLAGVRGIAPEEIVRANCLTSADVASGDLLFLPPIILPPQAAPAPAAPAVPAPVVPIAPAPAAPAVIAPAQPAATPSSGPGLTNGAPPTDGGSTMLDDNVRPKMMAPPPNAPTLQFPTGDPNLTNCPTPDRPYVTNPGDATRGKRTIFYFCGFADPNSIRVRLDGPSEANTLPPTVVVFERDKYLPNDPYAPKLDVELGNLKAADTVNGYQGAVIWYPTCEMPLDDYQLIVEDSANSRTASGVFKLTVPSPQQGQIMLAPKISLLGAIHDIFYCDYPPDADVQVRMYREDVRLPCIFATPVAGVPGTSCSYRLRPIGYWFVKTNSQGWAQERLRFLPADPFGMYRFCDNANLEAQDCRDTSPSQRFRGLDTIWRSP